jgi:hypothetical protein
MAQKALILLCDVATTKPVLLLILHNRASFEIDYEKFGILDGPCT